MTWQLAITSTSGVLTISGAGAMADFSAINDLPWKDYRSFITSVVIEDGVTSISDNAFRGCTNLATVTIPASVTSIGDCAFMNTAATVYVLPSTPPTLGNDAFNDFNGTIYVHGDAYDSADGWTGLSKTKIYAVSFSSGATTSTAAIVSDGTNNYYTAGADITLGHDDSPGYTFDGYTVTKDGTDPEETVEVTEDEGVYTFEMPVGDVTATANLEIIRFVKNYGNYDITYECTTDGTTVKVAECKSNNVESITIPRSVEYNSVSYNVTEIGVEAFMNSNLTSINMISCPITIIHARAFKGCMNLSEIELLPSLMTIEEEAFSGTNLTKFTFPESLTSIGDKAFADCSSLTSVTILGSEVVLAENAFEDCNGDLIIYVPEDEVFNCRNRWPAYAEIIYAEGTIPYIDADGSKAYCTNCTVLTGSTEDVILGSNGETTWYVVNSDVNYEAIKLVGNVNLILCDDCTMSIGTGSSLIDGYGITKNGESDQPDLHIYGQTNDTGSMKVFSTGGISAINSYTQYGGNVTVTGSENGIFSYNTITINGGSINANSMTNYEGNITINGGKVTVTGDIYAVDGYIVLNWTNASDRITASSFTTTVSAGTSIKSGKVFTDGQGNTYIGTLTQQERDAIAGKTLQPATGMTLAAKAVMENNVTNFWTTFYCAGTGFSIDAAENACAYTATVSGTEITLHKLGRVIPAGTAVIIVGADESISMTVSEAAAEYSVEGNDLHGVDVATPLSTVKSKYSANAILVLSNKNNHFGFHDLSTTNVPARKAFLAINEQSGARQFTMVFDDATGIHSIDNGQLIMDNEAGAWYSLDGRRLSGKPTQKGLYIHNGNKVLVK